MLTEHAWRPVRLILVIAAIAGLAALVAGFLLVPQRFFQGYLLAFLFWSGISQGCLGWLLLHNASGGQWGFALQRIFEAGARTLPLMALLFLPVLLSLETIYPWVAARDAAGESLWLTQDSYLNVPFWLARAAVYFAVWIGFALVVTRWSYESDQRPQMALEEWQNRVRRSAAGIVVYTLTANFAAVDWLMSLEPEWYSSVFGWLAIARYALGALVFAILVLGLLQLARRATTLHDVLSAQALNDMGAVFLATLLSWAYLALMQFLVIWTANIPREAVWYLRRADGSWLWVLVLLVLAYVALPTLLLLLRPVKRRLRYMTMVAGLVLALHLVHNYWLVMPAFGPALSLHWLDLTLSLGMGGLWLALFAWQLLRHPLLPENHPALQHDLARQARRTVV